MTRLELTQQIRQKKSYLCIGLDTDLDRIPRHLLADPDPVFAFNKAIIDSTRALCVSYKINTAFYEARGIAGWESLQKTVDYIPSSHFKIADAKRGDIGNTSAQYARAFFETLQFDAVTVAPYMGRDSVQPFLEYPGKWTIVLGLTSNPGSADFELQSTGSRFLYEMVLEKAASWGTPDNMMFVVGATRSEWMERIRKITPKYFYLVPGIGAQDGSLDDVSRQGLIADVGLLVHASRSVIYASGSQDFAEAAARVSSGYQQQMQAFLD